ncbi:asparagine synthase (glutamine-hydrolyzing) [Paenibacillus sp. UMB4589-SE434]|uniref:asparagine synthase (glutamine-hydrolyzing) n=1 Tax=Paenibacillus sp. UMB4589-SE434 TaxID=3046314 RepID=UPI002550DACF|nr:asparagine synthase (glutamine-hydrolyzing) [Paenibacillus sp. UMB4589-SE434]MDK8183723.1 asparagine synthase (glutamine-hydrolyzing) [Paenibacillus sp. UMB4589-SE434]
MCGITGWIDWKRELTGHTAVIEQMTATLDARGPDAKGTWVTESCALGHRRLSVIDPVNGMQPMIRNHESGTYAVVYNGELYNAWELRRELESRGYSFQTNCDTEVLLVSYIEWREQCVEKFNGIFAFAIWHEQEQKLFVARDRLGVKPLFYSRGEGWFAFGSEPKSLLQHPSIEPAIGAEGIAEIFLVGPARTPGHGVYSTMSELRPGHNLTYDRNGLRTTAYWKLQSEPHELDAEATAAEVRELLIDTVERQLVSDVPVGTLLSGGLDSSALTALTVQYYNRLGLGQVDTYSVDYVDNDKHFKAHSFQPNADAPWIHRMVEELGTNHHYVQFDTPELVNSLEKAVLVRDLPGMTDIDGSLYLFCREIKKGATVALSGEAADEVFGGYPWFHRAEALNANTFPWALAAPLRKSLLKPEIAELIKADQYVADRYADAIQEVPLLTGEDETARKMRRMSYLNITRFMPTLLDRKDRMSMGVGLEVRVPYTDHRLVQYVFNIPWEIKTYGNREKGLLRKALEGILPDDVLYRKKSPYPKTHNPSYLNTVRKLALERLDDAASPLHQFIDESRIREIAASDEASSNLPWFGQLMSGPQLFAYLLQVDYWLRHYNVKVTL